MGESSMKNENEHQPDTPVSVPGGRILSGSVHKWALWAAGAVSVLAVVVTVSMVTVRLSTPRIVTFDMKGTMDLFIQQTAQQKMDTEKAKALLGYFNRALMQSLTEYQTTHRAIILVAPAVVSIQPDITTEIQNDIARRMQDGHLPGTQEAK
jgi:conjugal transfer pilin signal peptidase TrbI